VWAPRHGSETPGGSCWHCVCVHQGRNASMQPIAPFGTLRQRTASCGRGWQPWQRLAAKANAVPAWRVPLRRAMYRTSPLHGARAIGFERPAWGTCEFLRRLVQCRAVAKPREWPQTSTLITCLVQPWRCNQDWKLRGAIERGSSRPVVGRKPRVITYFRALAACT
jgi:hypothetical protein